jgi:hypothetical protein
MSPKSIPSKSEPKIKTNKLPFSIIYISQYIPEGPKSFKKIPLRISMYLRRMCHVTNPVMSLVK